jgi:hypothetical protein
MTAVFFENRPRSAASGELASGRADAGLLLRLAVSDELVGNRSSTHDRLRAHASNKRLLELTPTRKKIVSHNGTLTT